MHPTELSLRAILLGIFLAAILAASNTYLALKIGILTSASIPAAILSMGILRFFKRASILENNLVQTAASAGEAVAGGIVYTIPGLIIIHYWQGFNYWENFFIALLGGTLGVLFSIPLRRILVHDESLRFPEGRAIAYVLQMDAAEKSESFRLMLQGGLLGGFIELLQTGLQVAAASAQSWLRIQNTIVGASIGFSATMVGAGFLMGARLGFSLLVGATLAWLLGIPLFSTLTPTTLPTDQAVILLWNEKLRYVGIGAMLTGGLWTLLCFLKPFYKSLATTLQAFSLKSYARNKIATEQDIPLSYILFSLCAACIALYFLLQHLFFLPLFTSSVFWQCALLIVCLIYLLLISFAFSTICGYFSGMVGVTASPGSAIALASVLITALLIRCMLEAHAFIAPSTAQLQHAGALVIIITGVVMGASAIANDNIQDLKVGQLIKATPWKQQLMLFIGTVVASAVIPLVMQLLFSVYGIGDVLPHANMNPHHTLSAPPATMMAMLAQAVFTHQLPLIYLAVGAGVIVVLIFFQRKIKLSILGVGIGMYLPLTTSTPLIMGSMLAYFQERRHPHKKTISLRAGTVKACGIVAGAALMDVLLAIPMVISGKNDVLNIMPTHWHTISVILGFVTLFLLVKKLDH